MELYQIADVVFAANIKYNYTKTILGNYVYHGEKPAEFFIDVSKNDLKEEKARQASFMDYPDFYLESTVVFRALCNYLLNGHNGIIFHSSAIEIDNRAYLFTAPSGTGKSTHTALIKQLLKDKMSYINDDKPIIRYIDNEFYVYGTPWMGKSNLGKNTRVKLGGIFSIYRSSENIIEKVSPEKILLKILKQTLMPTTKEQTDNLFLLISKMLKSVPIFSLGCNMDISAAELSYKTICEARNEN